MTAGLAWDATWPRGRGGRCPADLPELDRAMGGPLPGGARPSSPPRRAVRGALSRWLMSLRMMLAATGCSAARSLSYNNKRRGWRKKRGDSGARHPSGGRQTSSVRFHTADGQAQRPLVGGGGGAERQTKAASVNGPPWPVQSGGSRTFFANHHGRVASCKPAVACEACSNSSGLIESPSRNSARGPGRTRRAARGMRLHHDSPTTAAANRQCPERQVRRQRRQWMGRGARPSCSDS